MKGETPEQAALRAIGPLCDEIRAEVRRADRRVVERIVSEDEDGQPRQDEVGCTLSPPHDLLRNSCVKVAGEWCVFKRLDERGHLVVAKPGTCAEWTYEPTYGETFLTAEPF